jgi:hypothetical protein
LSSFRKRLAAFWASTWTLLILVACWTPRGDLPVPEEPGLFGFSVPHLDKLIHAAMFAGFGFLWMHAGRPDRRRAARVLGLGLILAALTEAGQALPIVARDAALDDLAADAAGLCLGVLGVLAMERLAPRAADSGRDVP